MNQINSVIVALLVLVGLTGATAVFTVPETQRALVLRLGKLNTTSDGNPAIYEPGLHFKLPFVSQVLHFDKRLQTLELKDARIVTKEKKDVLVNSFIKWRVDDFATFYKATNGNFARAGSLLGDKVSDALRAEFGKRTIRDVVSGERVDVMDLLQQTINQNSQSLGVDVVDVRIKRIDLPTEVSESVYDRMRAEREQAATQHRADGKREAEKIRASADKRVIVLLAEADRQAKLLRGEGDGQAAQIYAQAYGKNPEFFAFYKSLESYKNTFKGKDDLLVLSPDNEFFKYFTNAELQKK